MTASQHAVLRALGDNPATVVTVASRVDGRVSSVYRTLDALTRRSLVTINPDGRYQATERGRKKVAG